MSADVTVVIPCYNAERFVGQAIQSALDQGPNVEVIVVDDGSTDASLEVIARFSDRIRFETGPNRGACAARNAGLAAARGGVILFLDADDYFEGNIATSLATRVQTHDLDVAIGLHKTLLPSGETKTETSVPFTKDALRLMDAWSRLACIQTSAIAWRSQCLRDLGGWRPSLKKYQDVELMMRALLNGVRAESVPVGFAVYRSHFTSTRITQRSDASTLTSVIDALIELKCVHAAPRVEMHQCVGRLAYAVARMSLRGGHVAIGLRALSVAREIGFSGHEGSVAHRLGASIAGLVIKEKLAVSLRRSSKREFLAD